MQCLGSARNRMTMGVRVHGNARLWTHFARCTCMGFLGTGTARSSHLAALCNRTSTVITCQIVKLAKGKPLGPWGVR